MESIVRFESGFEVFNIVEDEEGAGQEEDARQDAEDGEQSSSNGHVKHEATCRHSRDFAEKSFNRLSRNIFAIRHNHNKPRANS
jgi:hypothetical protein